MRAAIIFLVNDWNTSYSLVSVVQSQISSFANAGIKLKVLNRIQCPPWKHQETVEYYPCLSNYFQRDRAPKKNIIVGEAKKEARILAKLLANCDVVLTHDVLYLPTLIAHNLAVRKAAEQLPNTRWFHWSHSSPRIPPKEKADFPLSILHEPMQNSTFVCVNPDQREDLSRHYQVPKNLTVAIRNSTSISQFFQMHPLSVRLIEKADLLSADIVCMYPFALHRRFKQHEYCLYLAAALKELGNSIRFLFPDPNTAKDENDHPLAYMRYRWLAKKMGLSDQEVIFTSDILSEFKKGCPREVISDMFKLTNLFIHPSLAEACSLTLLEAAMTKNICVLNRHTKAFRDIGGSNVIWLPFQSLFEELKHFYQLSDEDGFTYTYYYRYYIDRKALFTRWAQRISRALEKNKALALFSRVRQHFNEDSIFKNQLLPLLTKQSESLPKNP